MYKINYYESADNDINSILTYISHNLKNPSAAINLKNKIIKSEKILSLFPHTNKCYENKEYKYFKYKVKNYLLFYTIDEENKTVNIVRVLYRKRNFEIILK